MFQRSAVVTLVLTVTVLGGDLATAKRQLAKRDVKARRAAIKTLVQLDNRDAVEVVINALRKAYREDVSQRRRFERQVDKSYKVVDRLGDKVFRYLQKATEGSREERDKNLKKALEFNAKVQAEMEKVEDARRALAPHLVLLNDGAAALLEFRSETSVARIVEAAKNESAGPLRNHCLGALYGVETPGVLPTLLAVAGDDDPRARSVAVRALGRHVDRPGVLEQLTQSAQDKCWQVRRGAYETIAKAPLATALPVLIAARASEAGDQARILDSHLYALTGVSLPEGQGQWQDWWTKHEQAVRDGTFRKTEGQVLSKPAAVAFGLPITSMRVRFVLDLSENMNKPRAKGSATTRLDYAKSEMIRALEFLPEGTRFEIIGLAGRRVEFARRPQEATPVNCKRAISWVRRLRASDSVDTNRLFEFLMPSYADPHKGKRVFEQLPDTFYLVFADLREKPAILQIAAFSMWNRQNDAVLHVAALGDKYPRASLLDLVRKTGGTFAGAD